MGLLDVLKKFFSMENPQPIQQYNHQVQPRPQYTPNASPVAPSKPERKTLNGNYPNQIHFPKKRDDVYYHFDIDKMPFYHYCRCRDDYADVYFIPAEYRQKAVQNITTINILLSNVHKSYPQIPLLQYSAYFLEFKRKDDYSGNLSAFHHHPLSYYLEPNPMPYSLFLGFGKLNNSYFDIYFDVHGNVVKMNLVCWHGNILYKFIATVYEQEFQITSAYKHIDAKQERIFDIDYELREKRRKEYKWVCDNLPDLAPKTQSVYTRMKHSKSQAYLNIKSEALKKGMKLDDNN